MSTTSNNLYIVRGLPGAGKTTLANLITTNVFSADDFFYENGKYNYNVELIHLAQIDCFNRTKEALRQGLTNIAVANTFIKDKCIREYEELAKLYNYRVFVMSVANRHGNNSIHDVPKERLTNMSEKWTELMPINEFNTFEELISFAPKVVTKKLNQLKLLRERPDYHPEQNVYEHLRIVTERLIKFGNIDLMLAGLFHDICKFDCVRENPNTGFPTSPGHDKYAYYLIMENEDVQNYISSMGANFENVALICKHHMRIKYISDMKKTKQDALRSLIVYPHLLVFSHADNMTKEFSDNEILLIDYVIEEQLDEDNVAYSLVRKNSNNIEHINQKDFNNLTQAFTHKKISGNCIFYEK